MQSLDVEVGSLSSDLAEPLTVRQMDHLNSRIESLRAQGIPADALSKARERLARSQEAVCTKFRDALMQARDYKAAQGIVDTYATAMHIEVKQTMEQLIHITEAIGQGRSLRTSGDANDFICCKSLEIAANTIRQFQAIDFSKQLEQLPEAHRAMLACVADAGKGEAQQLDEEIQAWASSIGASIRAAAPPGIPPRDSLAQPDIRQHKSWLEAIEASFTIMTLILLGMLSLLFTYQTRSHFSRNVPVCSWAQTVRFVAVPAFDHPHKYSLHQHLPIPSGDHPD